jgi:hypothetical protein
LPDRHFYAATAAFGLPPRYSVFDGRYALIRFDREAVDRGELKTLAIRWLDRADPPSEALFDLESDPLERENLVDRLPEVASRLRGLLDTQYALTGDDAGGEDDPALSDTDLERLRALGYVE